MKQKRVTVALGIIVAFSISIGMFHGGKFSRLSAQESNNTLEIMLGPEDVQDYVKTLIISRNPVTAVSIFERMSPQLVYQLLQRILSEEEVTMPLETKVEFLLSAAHLYLKNKKVLDQFFTLLHEYQQKNPQLAPFLIAAQSSFPEIITPLGQWTREKGLFNPWLNQASVQAVELNDIGILEKLYAFGVRPPVEQATRLLGQVVKHNKSPSFVPFLIRRLNADVDYAIDKKTLLMQAAQNNNYPLVQALLENNADPNILLDVAVGTASQIAFQHDFVPIQLLIDSYVGSYQKQKKRK